jgi:hypothetical protein
MVGHPHSLDSIRIVHFPESVELDVAVHTIDYLLEKRVVSSRNPDDKSLRFEFFGRVFRLDFPVGSFLSHGLPFRKPIFSLKGIIFEFGYAFNDPVR